MRSLAYVPFFILFFISCQKGEKQKASLSHIADWGKEAALSQVESICFDSAHDLYYVSNGKAYQPGVEGFISRFSAQGDVLETRWIDSLHRPTGMAVKGDTLFVADVDRLLAIDIEEGKIVQSYPSPIPNSGLNDVSISEAGDIYVSASFIHAIMKKEGDSLLLWMQDENMLEYANGLYISDGNLWVAGMQLSRIELENQKIKEVELPAGVQDFDGIYVGPNHEFFLSTVENSSLWFIDPTGVARKLLEGKEYYLGDFHYAPNGILAIPRGSHEKAEYFISVAQFSPKK